MTDCKPQIALGFHPESSVQVTFDAPHTSSDGGLLLLRQADERLRLIAGMAACVPDDRDATRVGHERLEQVRQRVFQIAMGYEDCNDADTLRDDPVLKTVCDRGAKSERGLSSQPTLSRFENAVTGGAIRNMLRVLESDYVEKLAADTQAVILDIDSTDDATHGAQQLAFFHGFYDQHMYHPLLVIDGDGQLVTLPRIQICVRGDSAFCLPGLLDALEQLDAELADIEYILGVAKNARLLALAATAMTEAEQRFESGERHVRHFATSSYAAKTWGHERHVVIKAEHGVRGANPRFVVTTLRDVDARTLYDVGYCARGQCENHIKDFKNALCADRLSCSRFVANFFRLLLHAMAYRLLHEVRRAAREVGSSLGNVQMDTLRLRLLKVAAHVTQSVRRILVRLPRAFPFADVFAAVAAKLMPPAPA